MHLLNKKSEKVVQKFSIHSQNTYNLNEIGFRMGYAQNVKVIEIIQSPRGQEKLFRNHGIQ